MKVFPVTFLFGLLVLAQPLAAQSPPPWAARNPSGSAVTLALPALGDVRSQHLAWPKVLRTSRGTVLLAACAGQGHNTGSSGPAVARSSDGGRTFAPPQVLMRFPDDDPRYHDCGNLAFGLAPDGAVLLLAMAFAPAGGNNIYGWRSADDGVTWSRTDTSALGPDKTGSVFGRILPVEGHGLVVLGHYRAGSHPFEQGIWIAESANQGKTWGEARRIADVPAVEPVLVSAGSRLVGFFRGESKVLGGRQYIGVSDDSGITWKTELSVLDAENRATARLAAPFAVENPTKPGEIFALTTERAVPGNTPGRIWLWRADARKLDWKRERVILEVPHIEGDAHTDFGYPWLLHVSDNRWLMYYYHGAPRAACPIWVTEITL